MKTTLTNNIPKCFRIHKNFKNQFFKSQIFIIFFMENPQLKYDIVIYQDFIFDCKKILQD